MSAGDPTLLPKPLRGFAALPLPRRLELARKGGQAVQAKGVAHRFTHDEAKAAAAKSHTKRLLKTIPFGC